MGGSKRRLKKHAPKVRVGVVKRSKKLKAPTPNEVSSKRPGIASKVNKDCPWSTETTALTNYHQIGFANNPNTTIDPLASHPDGDDEEVEMDDDMRTVLGKPSASGRKLPDALTARQRKVVAGLIGKHGDNIDAMVKDNKLNKNLLTAGQLKRMVVAYAMYPERAPVRFQQPKKGLW